MYLFSISRIVVLGAGSGVLVFDFGHAPFERLLLLLNQFTRKTIIQFNGSGISKEDDY